MPKPSKRLLKKLTAFLAERRKSDGGWAVPTKQDMQQLDSLLYQIIEEKFQRDSDGDLPVRFVLTDLTRYEYFHFRPVLRDHDYEPGSRFRAHPPLQRRMEVHGMHMLNLALAHDEAAGSWRLFEMEERERAEKAARAKQQDGCTCPPRPDGKKRLMHEPDCPKRG
jgi:hypothetical protein